ncbi:hypothetical protein CYMTET_47735 [Cymbomonas tetramitiformis]|uniref:Uncharacterized protein n=1 Tax=Cymbomonas tetramitiformis TaxID=36881 RepID=A0AAE0BTL7_9CHLO|nr:hypothetical protein CYMTET_47735 [Cymbomonas tetramitiformis]
MKAHGNRLQGFQCESCPGYKFGPFEEGWKYSDVSSPQLTHFEYKYIRTTTKDASVQTFAWDNVSGGGYKPRHFKVNLVSSTCLNDADRPPDTDVSLLRLDDPEFATNIAVPMVKVEKGEYYVMPYYSGIFSNIADHVEFISKLRFSPYQNDYFDLLAELILLYRRYLATHGKRVPPRVEDIAIWYDHLHRVRLSFHLVKQAPSASAQSSDLECSPQDVQSSEETEMPFVAHFRDAVEKTSAFHKIASQKASSAMNSVYKDLNDKLKSDGSDLVNESVLDILDHARHQIHALRCLGWKGAQKTSASETFCSRVHHNPLDAPNGSTTTAYAIPIEALLQMM